MSVAIRCQDLDSTLEFARYMLNSGYDLSILRQKCNRNGDIFKFLILCQRKKTKEENASRRTSEVS
jgi:hypothetical protein